MMLATNKEIRSKDEIRIARAYFSRWRIEEYFRWQTYQFENFCKETGSSNALNFYITLAMAFLAGRIKF